MNQPWTNFQPPILIAMGAACARRRPPLVAEGETPFWEELDRASAVPTLVPGADTAPEEEEEVPEKDEVELPGQGNLGWTMIKYGKMTSSFGKMIVAIQHCIHFLNTWSTRLGSHRHRRLWASQPPERPGEGQVRQRGGNSPENRGKM